ncbi:MAG: hypothetical protein K6G87_11310 [Butyrivibrio sp.]|uniref:hypothetical protein n=1 Tax=Butyrivibrio sp. TaxID=28121 RepID=UPI0025E5F07A|nr:hypothetical protein [Butyrivibrio sp.]MCR5771799.1 hypothetical protein [Butyrivibrio sp.]
MYLRTKTIFKTLTAVLMAMIIAAIPLGNVNAKESDSDFEEYTVVDNDEVCVTITGIEEDEDAGYILEVSMVNYSEDVTYMYSAESASFNGVCVVPYFYSEVKPGKKANEDFDFYLTDEEKELIGEITDIYIVMRIYDSDDWSADDVYYDGFHIYPQGEENAENVYREDEDGDIIIAESDDIKVVLIGTEMDEYWGYELKVYVVNNTDKRVIFTIDDASINGYMIDSYWAVSVLPNSQAFDEITFYTEDLEDIDVTSEEDIEDMEFALSVYDADDYSADNIYEEDISLTYSAEVSE